LKVPDFSALIVVKVFVQVVLQISFVFAGDDWTILKIQLAALVQST
jgi:hypothetical protein